MVVGVLLLLLPAFSFARDYCYTGRVCTSDRDCLQNVDPPSSSLEGHCCSGHCLDEYAELSRGATCNLTNSCGGVCQGECQNNTCTEPLASGCTCQNDADCETGLCNNAGTGGVCLFDDLGYLAPCIRNEQCDSGVCMAGLCTGSDRDLGWPCRDSSECMTTACTGGVCSLVTEGGHCPDTSACVSGLVCRGSPGACLQPTAIGASCAKTDECPSNATCETQDSNGVNMVCKLKLPIGSNCDPAYVSCVDGAICSLGKCIKYFSRPRGASCGTPLDCVDGSVCSTTTANMTDTHCIAEYSLTEGSYCSYPEYACVNNSFCTMNLTTNTSKCGPVITDKTCDYNSTTADGAQCYANYECGCNGKCESTMHEESDSDECYNVEMDFDKGTHNSPGNMTKEEQVRYANYYCCVNCIERDGEDIEDTTDTGYIVDCKAKTVSATAACTKTALSGVKAFQHCDGFVLPGAAVHASGASFALLALLLCATLFGLF